MPCDKRKNDIYFDIQKVHALPVLTIRKAYYKHKQIAYNECKTSAYSLMDYKYHKDIASVVYNFAQKHCGNKIFYCRAIIALDKTKIKVLPKL